jgi:hypothetical protein
MPSRFLLVVLFSITGVVVYASVRHKTALEDIGTNTQLYSIPAPSPPEISQLFIQQDSVPAPQQAEKPKKWYDLISIRGYTQVRYNRLLETDPDAMRPLLGR